MHVIETRQGRRRYVNTRTEFNSGLVFGVESSLIETRRTDCVIRRNLIYQHMKAFGDISKNDSKAKTITIV